MFVVLNNIDWMLFNIVLAVLPVVAGWLLYRLKQPFLRIIFALLWLDFVPNTLYILTDLIHVPKQLAKVSGINEFYLLTEYFILIFIGIICYMLAMYPVEKLLSRGKPSWGVDVVLFCMNMVIAFGVLLGRFQRTNSWEVITDPFGVMNDIIGMFSSGYLLLVVILFGLLSNFIYFLLRRPAFVLFELLHTEHRKSHKKYSRR